MTKLDDLKIQLRIAMYMQLYQPKRELYWKQIAKDLRNKIKKLKSDIPSW